MNSGRRKALHVGRYFRPTLLISPLTQLMTQNFTPILGGIYLTKWDERPFRILAFDDYEIFYDCYWQAINKWSFGNLKGKGSYYRMTPQKFLDGATLLREQPMTENEFQVFRPDLPFRLCRNKHLSWTQQVFPDIEIYLERVTGNNEMSGEVVLPVPEITLRPFGSKGGAGKATVITAKNGNGFSCMELLWNAHNIQTTYLKGTQEGGVGIYRLGHEKKMPAYYIGGYYDNGGFIPKEE